jgi:transglutaminase-like putative cysteine protease
MPRFARYTIYYAEIDTERVPNLNIGEILQTSRPGVLQDTYDNIRRWERDYDLNPNALVISTPAAVEGNILYMDLLADYLIPRAARIHAAYTALPDHLPPRVGELARTITEQAGAETHFEMALALDSFLRTSGTFGYTLTPGNTPVDRDFVDHFLFDLEAGYCTHFASSFAVMARTLGIAARYVEGFIVTGYPDEGGYINVINRQGHAWADVYFEGFGWVRFDPTPPEAVYAPTGFSGYFGSFFEMWEYEFGMSGAGGDWIDVNLRELEGIYDTVGSIHDIAPAGGGFDINLVSLFLNALAAVTLLSIALIVFRILSISARDIKIAKKTDNNEAAMAYFHRILRYMRFFRYEIETSETPFQFARRVGKRIGFENDTMYMTDIAKIFVNAAYSTENTTDAERKILENAMHTLDKRLFGYMGPRRYFVYKYLMGLV